MCYVGVDIQKQALSQIVKNKNWYTHYGEQIVTIYKITNIHKLPWQLHFQESIL